jgi:hypothetical protein
MAMLSGAVFLPLPDRFHFRIAAICTSRHVLKQVAIELRQITLRQTAIAR